MKAQKVQDTFNPNEHTTVAPSANLKELKKETGKTLRREPIKN